jgi:hypothetical protein
VNEDDGERVATLSERTTAEVSRLSRKTASVYAFRYRKSRRRYLPRFDLLVVVLILVVPFIAVFILFDVVVFVGIVIEIVVEAEKGDGAHHRHTQETGSVAGLGLSRLGGG